MDDSDEYPFEEDSSFIQRIPWLETPLDTRVNSIRLLRLDPAVRQSPIVCSLKVVSLDENPIYETLSYVWGDPSQTQSITVGGEPFQITHNLANFLRWLRDERQPRWLWADAVCIDQTNEDERSSQIGLMFRIYSQAQEAHIWLGPFTGAWTDELRRGPKGRVAASDFRPAEWVEREEDCQDELAQYLAAGGKAGAPHPMPRFEEIVPRTLEMLDQLEAGKHLHEFPLFCRDVAGGARGYVMNRSQLILGDCFLWLVSRQWWMRVWTFQEAILPRTDPLVHAQPYSFRLSKILNSQKHVKEHMQCCRKLAPLWGVMNGPTVASQALSVNDFRDSNPDGTFLPLHIDDAIANTRQRKATKPKDHFIGMLGLLEPELQANWPVKLGPSASAAALFGQCSKFLYASAEGLLDLGQAKGFRDCDVDGLASWAIDLSTPAPTGYDGDDRWQWQYFDTSSKSKYEGIHTWEDLLGPELVVKAIPIGSIEACGRKYWEVEWDLPLGTAREEIFRACVSEWETLYERSARFPDFDRFWKAIVMDRNIWRWPFAERGPMPPRRVAEFREWWKSFQASGDHRDLDIDQRSADRRRGDYHYRALRANVTSHRFLCTDHSEPGIGPFEMKPGDEAFVVQGCPAPAVLRRISDGSRDHFAFVGLCFIDGWMYGKASAGMTPWRDVTLL